MKVWILRQREGRGWVRDAYGVITGAEASAGRFTRDEARALLARLNRQPGRVRVFAVEVEVHGPRWEYAP